MKIRKQPERKARRNGGGNSLVKSDRQLRSKLKQHIQARTASTSCSSSHPGQLRKNRESCRANMAGGPGADGLMTLSHAASGAASEGKTHNWSYDEVDVLLQSFKDTNWRECYSQSEREYSRTFAGVLNDHFHSNSFFTEEKVRSKVRTLRSSFIRLQLQSDDTRSSSSTRKGKTSTDLLRKYEEDLRLVFIENEGTSSRSEQVEPRSEQVETRSMQMEPRVLSKIEALDFMRRGGSTIDELLDYAVYMDQNHLDVFSVLRSFKERKNLFNKMVKQAKEVKGRK